MAGKATAKIGIQRSFGNITAGDIQTFSIPVTTSAPGFASANLYYKKIGKLYFDMRLTSVSGGFGDLPIGAVNTSGEVDDTFTEIAALIGVTINTKYKKANLYTNVNDVKGYYNTGGGYWQLYLGGNPHDIIDGFLAN